MRSQESCSASRSAAHIDITRCCLTIHVLCCCKHYMTSLSLHSVLCPSISFAEQLKHKSRSAREWTVYPLHRHTALQPCCTCWRWRPLCDTKACKPSHHTIPMITAKRRHTWLCRSLKGPAWTKAREPAQCWTTPCLAPRSMLQYGATVLRWESLDTGIIGRVYSQRLLQLSLGHPAAGQAAHAA